MQLAVNIVVLSAIYALIACGYVLVYRVSRVLNLAHGELMMLGSYLLLTTAWLFAPNPLAAMACAIVLALVVGILVYAVLMRRMTGESVLAAVLTTLALGILLRGAMVLVWSGQEQYPAQALNLPNLRSRFHSVVGSRRSPRFSSSLPGSSMPGCSFFCGSAGGACACALPDKIRFWPSSAASICTPPMRWLGRFPP